MPTKPVGHTLNEVSPPFSTYNIADCRLITVPFPCNLTLRYALLMTPPDLVDVAVHEDRVCVGSTDSGTPLNMTIFHIVLVTPLKEVSQPYTPPIIAVVAN